MHTATPQQVIPEWLRIPEAERYAGLGRSTLVNLISSGELTAAKVGRSVRVNRSSIDEFMQGHALHPKQKRGDAR
jgi:excisionase family DNA binding protein